MYGMAAATAAATGDTGGGGACRGAERLAAGLNSGKIGEMETGEELDVRGPRLGIPIGKLQKKRGQFAVPSLRVRSSSLRTFGSVQ